MTKYLINLFFYNIIGFPARLNRPIINKVESTSIEISWSPPECSGGHNIIEYNLRFFEENLSRFLDFVYHITETSYTITDLLPATEYTFSVQSVDEDGRTSSFSSRTSAVTLPPGNKSTTLVHAR